MKKLFAILPILCFCQVSHAQEQRQSIMQSDSTAHAVINPEPAIIGGSDSPTSMYVYDGWHDGSRTHGDSLHLPELTSLGHTYINMYPYYGWGMFAWQLHKGLNVNLGASVFATIGDGPWSGTGFTQSIAAMYAIPVTDKLSLAIGGYLNNMYWAHDAYNNAGLNAVLGYKFDEHWEGYLFGQKSVTGKRMPMPLYDMGNIGDRIGAALKYNFNPKFSIQVSVSAEKRK